MPAKVSEGPGEPRIVDRFENGIGWIAHPEETMERASHALATEAGVWLVDPLDAEGVGDHVDEYGDVAGVVLLSNYHLRDADAFADRYGVPVTVPESMGGVADRLSADVERVPAGESVGGFELLEVAHSDMWQEYALWDGETLRVGESLGAADYLRVGDERLGVMLLRRLTPPRDALGGLEPERVLGGHGPGVHEDAADALDEALRYSRRRFPRAVLENGWRQVSTVLAAIRS